MKIIREYTNTIAAIFLNHAEASLNSDQKFLREKAVISTLHSVENYMKMINKIAELRSDIRLNKINLEQKGAK